ncbi:uncharacterized protein LOC113291142 [Papaver somniferum]|uniref:uncharacterized protein LOC113291142 n=1 Tax=Papaver somniferum TaxID=3469 RepID=UPI000E702E40|nr:uncharacterized protein LOC113291142 [Papaver somniferum]
MKIRQIQNVIVELENEEGELITTQQGIADILVNHFEAKFKYKEVQISEEIIEAVPKVILNEYNDKLKAIPSAKEIKKAVFDLDLDIDGFGGWFYKLAWDIISEDFVLAIQFCWEKEFIPAGMNANFLMLIPKVKNARKANQIRPIGLMNFCFKVFTKIITTRLSLVFQKIVSPQQGAFIKGRNIQDQIVLASEMINELDTKRRGGNVGLKLDISQAYDSLSWEFPFLALKQFGFSDMFIKWIHILLKSAKISVLVNGGPVGYFNVNRGLRQRSSLLSHLCYG